MKRLRSPQFPSTGTRSAMLLMELVEREQIFIEGEQWALELYDLEGRRWPLQVNGIDVGVTEVRLDWRRLSSRTQILLPLFQRKHAQQLRRVLRCR